ncbi:PAS domain S-box-containing protein [Actimicrobium sp. GrIS 1.19]|uniref:hybrid sensor histidine kinase/response regulator n=1 Tax=Actimicrobium sp. GrIS 1.19 TaxID=3071708 RepID=UPI002E02E070|nr:PAS domain S-box-containing protein [Actimicrobium sp. GrIS 1.19]
MRRRYSLFLQIAGALAISSVVLRILLGIPTINIALDNVQKKSATALFASASEKEMHLNDWLNSQQADVEVLAKSAELARTASALSATERQSARYRQVHAQVIAELAARTELRPSLTLAIANGNTGTVMAATRAELEGHSIADQPCFQQGRAGLSVQPASRGKLLPEPATMLCTPLRGTTTTGTAVVIAWIVASELEHIVAHRSGLYRSDDAYLINSQGEQVTASRLAVNHGDSAWIAPDPQAVKLALSGKTGMIAGTDFSGAPALIAYRWLDRQRLALITSIEKDETVEVLRELEPSLLANGVAFQAAAILLAILVARLIVRPIHTLSEALTRFGRGDLSVRLPTNLSLELAQLAVEFNRMADAISEKENQLRANAEQLELRVQDRTKALQRQANLLDLAHDAIIVRDPNGTIRFWNYGARETYGWSGDETIGHDAHALLRTRFSVTREQFDATLLETGRWEGELTHHRRDGTPIVVASRQAVKYDEKGAPAAILEINSDISERKHAEGLLTQAKEDAEAATRAKSEFLANMSHEIRTPMNGVIGLTNLVLKTPLSPQQHEYLNLIKVSADSLLRLLNDILDFSKMEARKLELDVVDFDVRELIGDTLKSFAASANERALELIHHVSQDVPERLQGDPGRLAQIIVNLTGNALKFTKQGEVVVRVVQESRDHESAMLRFSIADSGIGIPREQQSYIFNAFAQADSSTTREYGGTGLGLAIVSQLVDLMNGTIWVDSEPGKGTTFHFTARFTLPQPRRHAVSTTRVAGGLENMPVLVVDDNRSNCLMLQDILSSWTLRPALAENGRDGLALLQEAANAGAPFRLVLIDAQMPEFDGFALAEAIKLGPLRATAIVIILSSNEISGEVARCKALGLDRILQKPIKQSELFDAISTAIIDRADANVPAREDVPGLSDQAAVPLHVLIAEDNLINQRLIIDILQERGHTFQLAATGIEALQLFDAFRFEVILMDGQMPEMDGYEATREIRAREARTGGHTRIIAVTANAMKQDRDTCLAAGMDDYMSKPIDPDQLIALIERPAAPEPREEEKSVVGLQAANDDTASVFNASTALRRVRGRRELLDELIRAFLLDLPATLGEIDRARDGRDAASLAALAHRLCGAATTLSAANVAEAAARIEQLGRSASLDECAAEIATLHHCAARLQEVMTAYTQPQF